MKQNNAPCRPGVETVVYGVLIALAALASIVGAAVAALVFVRG